MLRDAAQAAVREVVGRTTIDDVLSEQRGQVESETAGDAAGAAGPLRDGARGARRSSCRTCSRPQPVRAAFDDVIARQPGPNRAVNEAQGYRERGGAEGARARPAS